MSTAHEGHRPIRFAAVGMENAHAFGQIEGLLDQGCDCSDVQLSYYPDLVRDVINRTEAACPQRHTFEVTRLAIRAQQSATMLGYAQ